jgi:zinc transport system substrate-binding protein
LQTASLPTGKVFPTALNIERIFVDGQTHSHGKDGAHSHAEVDPRVWTDPDIYRHQAETILRVLNDNDSTNHTGYADNHNLISIELDALVEETRPIMEKLESQPMAANKPLYNYFARRFDVTIKNFDLDAASEATQGAILAPKLWTQGKPSVVMLWDSEPTPELKQALSDYTHLRIDPLQSPPVGATYDYPDQYRSNLAVFETLISSLAEE